MQFLKEITPRVDKVLRYKYDVNDYLPEGDSPIIDFYKDKTILITGGTGFLGKILLEKLLRSCNVKRVYLPVRTKKDKTPNQRLEELFDLPIFEGVKTLYPNFREKITLINGEQRSPNLGIKDEDIKLLQKEVEVVFHLAATVRFDQDLKSAAYINVRSTRDLLNIAKGMKKLKVFEHVSTAYANCPNPVIEERFYESPMSCQKLLDFVDIFDTEQINQMTPMVIGDWPNTYTFTKCIAESLIKEEANNLPLVMFRPSIVVSSYREPLPGWLDVIYGPIGVLQGYSIGVIRTIPRNTSYKIDVVPADYCVNAIIASGYERTLQMGSDVPIYNYCSTPQSPLTSGSLIEILIQTGLYMPPKSALWFPKLSQCKCIYQFRIEAFFYHLIPAFFVDLVLRVLGKEPIALKLAKRANNSLETVKYFNLKEWTFFNEKVLTLWDKLNKHDKKNFMFDMKDFDMENYMMFALWGGRTHILKESYETLEDARKKFYILQAAYYFYWLILIYIIYFIFTLFF